MLTINQVDYSHKDFEALYQSFSSLSLQENTEYPLGVCVEDTATWLALCLYLKQHQCSVLPIHPSTPLATAKQIAKNAGCYRLYYKDLSNAEELTPEKPAIMQADAGLIQMSSGTTGEPKFIQRSWKDIDVEIQSYIQTLTKAETMTPVVACPVTHSYGLICGVLVALARKQQPIIVTNINPKYLIKVLSGTERPLLYSSPTMLQGLMRFWPKQDTLHAVMTSGTMMSQTTLDLLAKNIRYLFQQYGCSEAGCISINQNMTQTENMGTPLPHLALTCDGDAKAPGEIQVRVKHRENTVIHTQDLGYLATTDSSEIPQLHFVARQDDTIIVAGLNVYPQQVEDILLEHPHISDALIFKVEDPFAGQRVGLHFVSEQALSIDELRQWCSEYLADFQRPYHLKQVEKIDRMANGKVNRKKVAAAFVQSLQQKGTAPPSSKHQSIEKKSEEKMSDTQQSIA